MIQDRIREATTGQRSIAGLLRDLREETAQLLRQEVDLARTEVAQQAARAGRNLGRLAIGGLVAYAGVSLLFAGCSLAVGAALVAADLAPGAAYALGFLIVGAIVGLVGGVLVRRCLDKLTSRNLVPRQTVESLRENKEWIKEKVS